MSHQGLVKALDALERELGVPLFEPERSPTLKPTAYGEAFHRFAISLEKDRERLGADFRRIREEAESVSVGMATGVIGFLGASFVEDFERQYPSLRLVERELPDIICDQELKNGSFGLAITVYPYDEAFSTSPMYLCDRYVWICEDDRLASCDVIALNDLSGYHIGVMGRDFKNYWDLERISASRGIAFASVDCTNELLWLSKYADRPHRAAFTAKHVVEGLGNIPGIVARRIEGIPWGFGLSQMSGAKLSDAQRAFADYCEQVALALKGRNGNVL
jgi:DNA-binding transcriptional LysR family regulator